MHYRRFKRHGDPLYINPKCNRDGKYLARARVKTAQWKKDNSVEYNTYLQARKLKTKQATPPWVDLEQLRKIFEACPKGHHVDHIIPGIHVDVCGLNVPWNLQYLQAAENMSKGNKFDGTSENESWRLDLKKAA